MAIQQLESTDAFVVFDLPEVEPAVGQVRMARKILRDGAELLARSWTYLFASFEKQVGGASAGINAEGDERSGALAAFVDDVSPLVEAGTLLLQPAKGATADDLAALRGLDPRGDLYWDLHDDLRGLGAVVCADEALGGLEGRSVAVEGFDAAGPAIVKAVYDRGGRVTAVGTARGAVARHSGLDGPMLAQAWREHGPVLVEHVDVVNRPANELWSADVDVLFAGSRAGVIDHELAPALQVRAVVPSGPVPVTARALAMLRRAEVLVLPDFVTTAGPLFAMWPSADANPEGLRGTAAMSLRAALSEVLDHDEGPLVGACHRAEAFLATWRDELPFGRPIA